MIYLFRKKKIFRAFSLVGHTNATFDFQQIVCCGGETGTNLFRKHCYSFINLLTPKSEEFAPVSKS